MPFLLHRELVHCLVASVLNTLEQKGRVVEQNTDPFKRERQRKLSITGRLCSDHETAFGIAGALVTPYSGGQELAYA
jgi:hypothetical protein